MAVGPWTYFDRAKLKIADGTILLATHTFKGVLLTSVQAMSSAFVGSSGDCRYADLTAELTTVNGYTVGGATLTSVSLTRKTTSLVGFDGSFTWTPTLTGLTFKYAAVYDFTATNKDLLCFVDMDVGGGSQTATNAGPLSFTPSANGIVGWS